MLPVASIGDLSTVVDNTTAAAEHSTNANKIVKQQDSSTVMWNTYVSNVHNSTEHMLPCGSLPQCVVMVLHKLMQLLHEEPN